MVAMRRATVSVVIPLFNGLPYAPLALDSVLNQSHTVDEIVICDGGSTDGSLQWLRGLQSEGIVRAELPAGTSAAQNWTHVTELASCDYVKLLCQDDYLYPGAIAAQVSDLDANPSANMAVFQRDIIDSSGSTLARARGCQGLRPGIIDGKAALKTSYLQGTNVLGEPVTSMFRREPMQAALPWIDDQPYVLDIMFDTEVLKDSSLFVRKEALGAFRVSATSWSTQLSAVQRNQFRTWQKSVEPILSPLSLLDRLQGRVALERQTQVRKAAYAYLRFVKRVL